MSSKRQLPRPRRTPFLIFYVLVAYILLQFAWWTYLMVDLNRQVHEQGQQLEQLTGEEDLVEPFQDRLWMIVGEGSVFLLLLVLGVYRIKRSFDQEIRMAEQQKNFLAAVTHELKTPLASTKLFLQTLEKRELDRDQQKTMAGKAIGEVERLHSLVDNILLADQLDSSRLRIHPEEVEMAGFIRNALSSAVETLGKDHDTRFELEEGHSCRLDRGAMASVLLNLYENAVKYSPAGSGITVFLRKEGSKVHFGVTDQGPGVRPEEVNKITRKFYRVGNEETRTAKGTGLGLFIVREIVSIHNGSLSIAPHTPQGTTFTVVLPAS